MLLKLGFINERPEFGPNRRWQQSGDCYLLTLFRDYGKPFALAGIAVIGIDSYLLALPLIFAVSLLSPLPQPSQNLLQSFIRRMEQEAL